MTFSHTFLSSSLVIFCICCSFSIFAEDVGCDLSDTSSSPLQKWKENIDTLNSALRSEAGKANCDSGSSTTSTNSVNSDFTDYAAKILPLDSSVSLMREMYSLSSNGADFISEVGAFMDPAGPVQELKPHLDSVEEIERSIIQTAQFVGSHCAHPFEVKTNILEGKSGYNTRGRSMYDVLVDMAKQTKEVKRFFQILSQGIQTEEYIDEVPFMMASPGFSKDMYVYYSPKNIQECRDNDPRKGAFMEVLKGAFTSGWKYPQAIQLWKDAMALLLYRGSSLAGGAADASKDAQINNIVQAQKGGLGNSDIMINSQFFKEFGYRPDSKPVDEKIEASEKKALYETMGYEFIRKVLPSIFSQNGTDGAGYIKNAQLQEEGDDIKQLQNLEENLYRNNRNRAEGFIKEDKADDAKLSSELAKTIQSFKVQQKTLEELVKNKCKLLKKQAVNIGGAWRCQ